MTESNGEESICFSNVPSPRKMSAIAVVALGSLFCVWLICGPVGGDDPLGLYILLPLWVLVCRVAWGKRGKWVLDEHGVSFKPWIGTQKNVAWDDVCGVVWAPNTAIVKSEQARIPLPWGWIDRQMSIQAKAFVENLLSFRFDLTDPPRPAPASLSPFGSCLRIAGLCLLLATPLWLALYHVFQDRSLNESYLFVLVLTQMGVLGAGVIIAVLWAWIGLRRGPRRWREPLGVIGDRLLF